jgi:DNA-binding LacI/PurR family transcriptional regulator
MKEEWFFYNAYSVQDGFEVFDAVKKMDNPPEAIFTGSDEVAAGIAKAAKDAGWKVPEDLAIIGFDNQPLAELMDLTTVEQPIEMIARKAMELMVEAIKMKNPPKRKEVILPFQLIKRTST